MKEIPTMEQRIISAMINFVYFLTNFPKPFEEIICEIYPEHLADHLNDKFWYFMDKHACKSFVDPSVIIDFILNLDIENQRKFMQYVETNYHMDKEHKIVEESETFYKYDAGTSIMELYHRSLNGLIHLARGGNSSFSCHSKLMDELAEKLQKG